MRSPITMITVLFLTTIGIRTAAQQPDVNPLKLSTQITDQESIVKTATGNQAWEASLKLAVLLQDAARYRESEEEYRRTIELAKLQDPATLADVLDHMGTMYVESGQLSRAEPMERQALAVRERQHDQLGAGVSHMHLAMLLLGENALRPAESEAESAVRLLVPEYSSSPVNAAATAEEKMTALIDLSLVRCASAACSTAIPALRWALKIAHASYPANSIPVGYLDFLLGNAYWKSGDSRSADELMGQGVHELATQIGWGHPTYLRVLRQYGEYLSQTGRTVEAKRTLNELAKLDRAEGAIASTFATATELQR